MSLKKSLWSLPWMLRNFILPPHSWTWRPARFETRECNTTHHKPQLPVCLKKKKKAAQWRALSATGIVTCCDALWCLMQWFYLHIDQALCKGVVLIHFRCLWWDLRAVPWFEVFLPRGAGALSSFDVQEPWKRFGIYSRASEVNRLYTISIFLSSNFIHRMP